MILGEDVTPNNYFNIRSTATTTAPTTVPWRPSRPYVISARFGRKSVQCPVNNNSLLLFIFIFFGHKPTERITESTSIIGIIRLIVRV